MAATVGSVIFVVVVVGGMGSLSGAFLASLLIGVIQTFAVAFDYSVATRWPQQAGPAAECRRRRSTTPLSSSPVAGGAHPAVSVSWC
jgi:branched-chain amino acid transport system permease protein